MIHPVVLAAALALRLDDAISMALARNLTYQSARIDADRAHGVLAQAYARRVPQVDGAYQHQTISRYSVPTVTIAVPNGSGGITAQNVQLNTPTTDTLSASASYLIYDGGAISAGIGEASAGYAGALESIAAARAQTIDATASAYMQLLAARRDERIAQDAVNVAQADVHVAQERFTAGTAARYVLLREQLSEANAESTLVDAHNAADLSNAQLDNLLNLDQRTEIDPTDGLEVTLPSYTLDALIVRARAQRAELQAATDAVDAARYAVRIARSDLLPAIALGATESNTHPAILGAGQPQLAATLTATWRLFDGGLTRGRVEQAQADLAQAQVELDQLQAGIDLDVHSAYANYVAATAKLDSAKRASAVSGENLRVSRIRFAAGVGTALELSDAALSDSQAQSAYVRAQANARAALVTLHRAAGEL